MTQLVNKCDISVNAIFRIHLIWLIHVGVFYSQNLTGLSLGMGVLDPILLLRVLCLDVGKLATSRSCYTQS